MRIILAGFVFCLGTALASVPKLAQSLTAAEIEAVKTWGKAGLRVFQRLNNSERGFLLNNASSEKHIDNLIKLAEAEHSNSLPLEKLNEIILKMEKEGGQLNEFVGMLKKTQEQEQELVEIRSFIIALAEQQVSALENALENVDKAPEYEEKIRVHLELYKELIPVLKEMNEHS